MTAPKIEADALPVDSKGAETSTAPPKVVTIDNERYQLIEIWVDYWFGDMKGKRKVYALNPIERQTNE